MKPFDLSQYMLTLTQAAGAGLVGYNAGNTYAAGTVGEALKRFLPSAAFTPGSVIFAGAGGVLSQDNANLFWDDTANRLGVGIAAPASPLHVKGADLVQTLETTSASGNNYMEYRDPGGVIGRVGFTDSANDIYRINNIAGTSTTLQINGTNKLDVFSTGIATTVRMSLNYPSMPASSSSMLFTSGDISFTAGVGSNIGYNGYVDTSGAAVWRAVNTGFVAAIHSNTTVGGLHFFVTSASVAAGAAASIVEVLTIAADSNVGIGTNGPQSKLHVVGGNIRVDGPVAGPTCTGVFAPQNDRNFVFYYSNDVQGQTSVWSINDTNGPFTINKSVLVNSTILATGSEIKCQPGGSGGVALNTSGNTTNTGYLALYAHTGVRTGYIGHQNYPAGGASAIVYINEQGGSHNFSGTVSVDNRVLAGSGFGFGSTADLYFNLDIGNGERGVHFMASNYISGTSAQQKFAINGRIMYWDGGTLFALGEAANLGWGSGRWGTVYAITGAINTSDAREKDWRGGLTPAELAAARDLVKEVGVYRWLTAIADKGDDARLHVGILAQTVQAVMERHGLDAAKYGFFCWDEWEERTDVDGEGNETVTPAGDRFGVRYDELTLFLLTAQEQRLAALEAA